MENVDITAENVIITEAVSKSIAFAEIENHIADLDKQYQEGQAAITQLSATLYKVQGALEALRFLVQ